MSQRVHSAAENLKISCNNITAIIFFEVFPITWVTFFPDQTLPILRRQPPQYNYYYYQTETKFALIEYSILHQRVFWRQDHTTKAFFKFRCCCRYNWCEKKHLWSNWIRIELQEGRPCIVQQSLYYRDD